MTGLLFLEGISWQGLSHLSRCIACHALLFAFSLPKENSLIWFTRTIRLRH